MGQTVYRCFFNVLTGQIVEDSYVTFDESFIYETFVDADLGIIRSQSTVSAEDAVNKLRYKIRRTISLLNKATPSLKLNELGKLWNTTCYLCGPIDKCPEGGAHWRRQLREDLSELGINFLDPTDKPNPALNEQQQKIKELDGIKHAGDFDEITRRMKPIRSYDLRCVDKCDYLIAYLDFDIRMVGTWRELAVAESQQKPILIVCKQGKKDIQNWCFADYDHTLFFDNFEQLKQYLYSVDRGEPIPPGKAKWWFFNE